MDTSEFKTCPYCEGFYQHMSFGPGRWICPNCKREWREGVEWRRANNEHLRADQRHAGPVRPAEH